MVQGFANMKNVRIFAIEWVNKGWGISSSPARALDWQSKGDEFESRMLHEAYSLENVFDKNDWSWAMQKFCAFV